MSDLLKTSNIHELIAKLCAVLEEDAKEYNNGRYTATKLSIEKEIEGRALHIIKFVYGARRVLVFVDAPLEET